MPPKIELRNVRLSDAKRLFDILQNPNFRYFGAPPENVEAEKDIIRKMIARRKTGESLERVILFEGRVVGICGVNRMMTPARKHTCSLWYFLDEEYWSRGIMTQAVKITEKTCFDQLGMQRIEIIMVTRNRASWKVAQKCEYKREGMLKKYLNFNGESHDSYIYAKINPNFANKP